MSEFENEPVKENDEQGTQEVDFNNQPNAAQYNEIEFSDVKETGVKQSKKGLIVFAFCIMLLIIATAATVMGYYFGQNSTRNDVNLAAKPKNSEQYTPAQIYDMLDDSVVGIKVFNDSLSLDASGVVYSEDGYIVTNDHIYSEITNPKFYVYTRDGKEYEAQYVAGDSVSDLAVLKIKDKNVKLPVPEFGNSKELVTGEYVAAIGRQGSAVNAPIITTGIVSSPSRRAQSASSYSSRLIQADNYIGAGNSGGALVNMYGQVVGIITSNYSSANYDVSCFAIPTVTVKRVADQLIADGKVTNRAKLGITYNEIDSVKMELGGYSATGLCIVTVGSDSDLSGKVNKDDIITHVNGIKIDNDDIMLDIIEDSKAGDKIQVTVMNAQGESANYEVTLKANVGTSSYNSAESKSSGGAFNFPDGE